MDLERLIYLEEDTLSEEFCQSCIEKFNRDPNRYQGVTGQGVVMDMKQSTDLSISTVPGWEREDKILYRSLSKALDKYTEFIPAEYRDHVLNPQTKDLGYQMQRTEPGGFYHWHHDQIDIRKLTYLWYLNDIYEEGYTEFNTGMKVQPRRGKLLIFPALWPWVHRGYPPKSEIKYIVTGWTTGP